jgi:hypothetical protein
VLQATSGSAKNLYAVTLTPSADTGGTCQLGIGKAYTGYAAITFADVGTVSSPRHVRSLTWIVRATAPASWLAAELIKS